MLFSKRLTNIKLFIFWIILIKLSALSGVFCGYSDDTCEAGRTVIVHLFNWKWTDIAAECERFMGPKGFCGVQVSPPNEHRVVESPYRPWWERYQPVSYLLESRSGSRQQFADMVTRCNTVGVRIYVDIVINHMVGESGSGIGSGGSYFNADTNNLSFPAVPYDGADFNCCFCNMCRSADCTVSNYNDVDEVRNCRLVGLLDLKLSDEYVREKVAEYLNDLISLGVAGFRVDAGKHMWPKDLEAIYEKVSDLNTDFGYQNNTKPFIFSEVIDLGHETIKATEYTHLGRVTEFRVSTDIGLSFRGWENKKLSYLKTFGEGWGYLKSKDALVFVDNHDNQRGHGAGGASILTFKDPKLYKMATAFTLAWPYGFTRIMSSYDWLNDWDGPPHNDSDINDVHIKDDGTCDRGWICEHRWRQITNMVAFRNVVNDTGIHNWWDNGNNQIAFSRGNKGFIAINNDKSDMKEYLQTGLPEGTYCDIISGEHHEGSCSGKGVQVGADGMANIFIGCKDEDPVIAIHEKSRITVSSSIKSQRKVNTTTLVPSDLNRTVIFMYYQSVTGQDLFLRGGYDEFEKPECRKNPKNCAIRISTNELGSDSHYDKHNAWRVGDNLLDWEGAESGQGSYMGQPAEGSPAVWTTDQAGASGYQDLNVYGEHYWMVDVNMDCSQTEGGWFELKAFGTNGFGWESDIFQALTCSGSVGGSKPYSSRNHFGRCGYVNVFAFSENGCEINDF